MTDTDPAVLLEEATKAFQAKDYAKALEAWSTALEHVAAEHHFALQTNRGVALERLGRVEEAIAAYDAALASKPDHVEALHNRGVALKVMKRLAEALDSFEKAIAAKPDFYPSWRGKTEALTMLERFPEAAEAARGAAALRASEPGPHADAAFALLKAKRVEEALREYDAAIELGDRSEETKRLQAIALSQRAVELDKAGAHEEAEKLYTRAIAQEATESRLFNRAFLYMRMGRTEEAIAGYREVMTRFSGNYQARAALGTLLLQREDFAAAIPVLEEAQALNDRAEDVVFNLGFAYLKCDRVAEAEKQFRRALELNPDMENAKNGLEAVVAIAADGGKPKYRLEIGPTLTDEGGAGAAGGAAAPAAKPAPPAKPGPPVKPPAPTTAPGGGPAGGAGASAAAGASGGKLGAAQPPLVRAASSGGGGSAGGSGGSSKEGSPSSSPSGGGSGAFAGAGGGGGGGRVQRASMMTFGSGVPVPLSVVRDPFADTSMPKPMESPSRKYSVDTDGVDGVVFPYSQLKAPGPFPDGIDVSHREAYMSMAEFTKVFGVSKTVYYAYPKWRRVDLRKKFGLF